FFEWAEHQGEGSTELVAHVAEKRCLGAIDLGQRLRALTLLLIGASAGQPDGDLFCDPADEVAVCIVERAARRDAKHQESDRLATIAQPDWQNRRFPWGRGPLWDGQSGCAFPERHHGAILGQCRFELPKALTVVIDDDWM